MKNHVSEEQIKAIIEAMVTERIHDIQCDYCGSGERETGVGEKAAAIEFLKRGWCFVGGYILCLECAIDDSLEDNDDA